MRTLALTAALATALAGTGCIVSSSEPGPTGQVNVYWDFLRYAPAQAPTGYLTYDANYDAACTVGSACACPEAGVDTVWVSSGSHSFSIECTGWSGSAWVQGGQLVNLPAGMNRITLTGYRGDTAIFSWAGDVNVPAYDFVEVEAHMDGLHALVDVYADLAGGVTPVYYDSCGSDAVSPYAPNFVVEVRDYFGTLIDTDVAGCPSLGALPTFVYTQDLDLDDYSVRVFGYDRLTDALVFDSCDTTLAHYGSQLYPGGEHTAILYASPLPACP